jgi:very-short-patch-repair endonuclease
MAHPDREKSPKSSLPLGLGAKGRAQREYIAKIVPLETVWDVVRAYGPGERVVEWVANQQLALITTAQLRAAGISQHAISRRCRRRSLHRVHQTVYLYGSRIMVPGALEFAAVLACAPNAWVCGRSALALMGVVKEAGTHVDVLVAGRDRRSRPGIRVHRTQRLDQRDAGFVRGIPVTAPARAIIDVAGEASAIELEHAIAEAYALKLVTDRQIEAAIGRAPYRAGVGVLRAELRREGGPQWTQSEGERQMLKLIRSAGLPVPRTQERIAGWPADFLWPEQRLIVEVDGYPFHSGRRAFERDRRRDQAHIAAGYTVIRVTWRQLTNEPLVVITTIARALERVASQRAAG